MIEEGEGDWIGRVILMESGGEWGRVIAEQRARESDGKKQGKVYRVRVKRRYETLRIHIVKANSIF